MLTYLHQFIPQSEILKCACYVLYDWHPRDDKLIDITICSSQGEVREFYKKDLVCSFKIGIDTDYRHIKILRNFKGELFYIVATTSEIIILSCKETIQIHRIINHVRNYRVVDTTCSGKPTLEIVTASRSLHLSIANNFEEIRNHDFHQSEISKDAKPAIDMFKQKIQEAKDNLQSNENTYQKILNLRQLVTYGSQQSDAGEMVTLKPKIVICNEKVVILVEMENHYSESIDNVCTLIHNNSFDSMSYTTKVFEIMPSSPFYVEMECQEIKCDQSVVVAAVIPLEQFNSSVNSKIEFKFVISYQRNGNVFLQSSEDVYVSASERMGKNFDVFKNLISELICNDKLKICALLSTSEKTSLRFKNNTQDNIVLSNMFCEYLNMEMLGENIAVLKHSPYHILYGMMIIFQDSCNFDVYTRSPSQVLALIHFIYDSLPQKLIVTTPKDEEMNEILLNLDYISHKSSLAKQATITLEYFDECLKEMNKSKDLQFQDMIGTQIDIFVMGYDKYAEYRNKMITEVENYGKQQNVFTNTEEVMEVEDSEN